LDLEVVDTVKAAGSDGKARRFLRDGLPKAVELASRSFTRDVIAKRFSELALDPARLDVVERTGVRVYFIGEASGYDNALGINTEGVGAKEGNPRLLFPRPYTGVGLYDSPNLIDPESGELNRAKLGERSEKDPVLPGDFVDLGSVPAGTKLSFFLIADDRRGNVNVYTPLPDRNPDGIAHMVAIAIEDSPYLILSFEDMYKGGDRDFSDCVFAVEMSAYNIQALLGRIDPWRQAKRMALLVLVIGVPTVGPLAFLAVRRAIRKARARKALAEAEQLLKAGQARKAVDVLENAKAACDSHDRARLEGLEISGFEQLGDVAGLWNLYRASEGLFEHRESASLRVGRAQVETEHFDEYQELRGTWSEREGRSDEWLALDVDVLRKQGKDTEGLALLDRESTASVEHGVLLAREAVLRAAHDPEAARALMARAIRLEPGSADVRLLQGQVIERLGGGREAEAAYVSALANAPGDPFVRDAVGEFYHRQGALRAATGTWRDGLSYPSLDVTWLKVLFWQRVSHPVEVNWSTLKPPESESRALIDFLLGVPPAEFWDAARFEPIAQSQPALLGRQEVFWLRLLQALKMTQEDEALSLLNLNRFGERSWHEELEVALLRILQFRRLGFMDPQVSSPASTCRRAHPFFATLNAWVRGEQTEGLEAFQRLATSEHVFSAACLAAGWCEAGLKLLRTPMPSGEFPTWFVRDILNALRCNRGEAKAQEFANEQGL
jgi:hypothetical protein